MAPARGGQTALMDEVWLEALATVAAEADAELRADAAEVFAAEAARIRLGDVRGPVRITLRSGRSVTGTVETAEPVDGHLVLASADPPAGASHQLLVPVGAVVILDGSRIDLRVEAPGERARSIGSWLRDQWSEGGVLRVLDRTGALHVGPVALVGADHVRLAPSRCIPFRAVDAWGV